MLVSGLPCLTLVISCTRKPSRSATPCKVGLSSQVRWSWQSSSTIMRRWDNPFANVPCRSCVDCRTTRMWMLFRQQRCSLGFPYDDF